jgi:hypothetical protein
MTSIQRMGRPGGCAGGNPSHKSVRSDFEPDLRDTRVPETQDIGGGNRNIDNSPANEGPAIVHDQDCRPVITKIGDTNARAKWKKTMGAGHNASSPVI